MPYRITPLVTGSYYHIFNRGVEKRTIFLDVWDYKRFLRTLVYYNDQKSKGRLSWQTLEKTTYNSEYPAIQLNAFCLMPNHFHLLTKQNTEHGISTFMRKVLNSYTKYFNTKYKRVGPLFQGAFKAVLIDSDEQFMHVLRYIHLNPFVSKFNSNIVSFSNPYSSYNEYFNNPLICDTQFGESLFTNRESFKYFHSDHLDYVQKLDLIKHFDED